MLKFITQQLKHVNHQLFLIYGLFFFYLFVVQVYTSWNYTVDDAYITLRYSRNLIEHHGLVWNIGGPKIEGYSNFLYVMFGAAFLAFHASAITLLKLLSACSIAVSAYGVYLISRFWLTQRYAFLPALILLIHPGEIIWGVSGLETIFYQSLILFSVYFILKGISLPSRGSKQLASPSKQSMYCMAISGCLLALASLTRPEAPMLFLCFLLTIMFLEKKWISKNSLMITASFSIIFAPYYLWRCMYFGRLFANTVYCKALSAPSGPWELDMSYLLLVGPLFVFIIPYLRKSFDKRFLFLLFPSLIYLIALYNADWIVGYLDRHFLTAYALILPLFVCGIHHIFHHKRIQIDPTSRTYAIVIFSIVAGFLFTANHYTLSNFGFTSASAKEGGDLRIDVANWLNTHVKKEEVVTVGDCGVIPYYYQGQVVDTYCLNNLEFTTPPINYSYARFADWLMDTKKPDYIILLSLITIKKAFYPPSDLILLGKINFHLQYKKIKRFLMGNERGGYQYVIYKRKENIAL